MNTKMKMRTLSLLLCFVMLVGLMPTTVFAAPTNIATSGDWNASNLMDNVSLTLTGNLNLYMDTNKTLSYIDIAGNDLKVTGPGTLTVVNSGTAIGGGGTLWSSSNMIVGATTESGAAYAIEVGTFTFYAESLSGSLVVEGQQGIKSGKLNISYSDAVTITARDGIAINSKDVTVNSNDGHITGTTYGIYSDGYKYAPHAVRLSGVIDIQSNGYGIHTSTNDAALWSDCKSLSISANTAISCDEMQLNRGHYLFNGSTQAVIFDSFDLNYYPESNLQIISPNNGSVSGTTIVDSEGDPAKNVRIYAPITEEVNVNVTAPVKGATPQTTSFTGNIPEHCSVKTAVWYENGTQMANNATFKGGKSYRVELTLETTDNYTFKYNIAGKINGVDANPQLSNNNSTMVLAADMGTLPDEIDLVDLSVDVPVAGATPAKPTTNTDFTSIYAYEWKLNGNTLGYGENFEGGQTYQLVVRTTTTKKFADNVVVKINGVTANVLSVDNNAGVLFESYFAIPMGDTYTVTFDANGGSGNMTPVNNVSGDYKLPACTFTAPSEKHFKAWNVGGNEKAVGDTISVTDNTTVTAVWEEDIVLSQEIDSASATITAPVAGNTPSYVITPADSDKYTVSVKLWYINEGNYDTLLPTDTYVAGKSYALRVTFSAKAGYCFADSASFKINGVSAHKYGSVGDVEVIFAVPAAQPTEYMVSYVANGGSGTMTGDMVTENDTFTLEPCTYTAPEGYKFKAWAIGSVNGEQKQPSEQITITAETYIYAIWEAVPQYNVVITVGNGMSTSGNTNQTVYENTAITDVVYTAADGYYFPTNYSVAEKNGISVTRNSYTQITVSGTPTAAVNLTLADATAKTQETTPSASFTATGPDTGTLSGVTSGMKYSTDGGNFWTNINSNADINLTGLSACTISVVKTGDGNTTTDSNAQSITVTKAAAPTTVVGVACATGSNDDGKLQNVTTAMEYKLSTANNWTDGTGSDITSLANGIYYVRVKASGTVLASDYQTVNVPAYSAVPTYGIDLDVNNTYSFDAVTVGYAAIVAKTVTVINTGNSATGALTVALSGSNANSFELNKTSIGDIAVSGSDTFTVVPKTGLSAGTYTATVTVSGGNSITANFNVSFTVNAASPTYSIALSPSGTQTFTAATVGYGAQTAKTITVNNTGTGATGALTVALSGSNANSFELNKTSIGDIAVSGSDTFTVVPKTGLSAGTYTATVTVSGGNSITANFNVSFTVNPAGGGGGNGGGGGYTYYTIKATAGTGGSISPTGSVSVREGRDQTFTITPDKGYAVSNVKIDGKSIGAVKSYTFENVSRTHTIEVIFMKANGNPQTGVFVDVATGSYYEDAVDWAVESGITKGTDDTHFSPDGICTRAQAVTFLWRAAGSPAAKSSTMPFTDVKAGSYYYDAVLWAVENGITKGTSDTMFSPDANCSRAQIVTFLWRSQKSPAAGTANPFADVKSTAYYAGAVLWAVKEDITKGTTNTTFSPDADCTRAQIVTFLWRALAE